MPGSNTFIGEIINDRQLWFNYDHEGRMTLANKTIEQDGTVTDPGVVITYDAAGRRAMTPKRDGRIIRAFTDPEGEMHAESWDQIHLEHYTYNDLGYLTKIEQAGVRSNKLNLVSNTPIPDDPGPSPFMPSETRSYDLLGNLFESSRYSHFRFVSAFDMTMEPQSLLVTVNNHYTAAGLLDTQTSTHPTSPRANSDTKNLYDNHGILQSYTYTKGDGLGTDADHGFKNTYTYSYSFKAGALREGGIDVESNLNNSTTTHQRNTYDGRGNLVWQRSIDGLGNTEMVFFDYEGSGRVLDKAKIDLPPSRQEISDDKYNSFFYNSSGEAIGNVPTSSFAATRASLHANFGIGFTPVSPTYPSSQPSSYAVVASDTLADIAKSFLGDAQLWYLIADANGLTTGPTDSLESQVGRSLRIPNVVANVRNNADTFSPYNPNTIIPNTPWVGAPLPPRTTVWEQTVEQMAPIVGMATSMVLSVYLSGLGPLGVGIAAAAGDFAKQSFRTGFGRKDWRVLLPGRVLWARDVDKGKVAEAGLKGFVAGGLSWTGSAAAAANGGGLAAQALAQGGAAAATYFVNSSIHEAFNRQAPASSASFSGWSLLTVTAGAAATPVLGGFFSRLAQEALNPKTGWVWHPNARAWDALYQELAMGLGQLAIQDSFGSPRHTSPKPEQRSQPIPLAVLEDPVDEKADLAREIAEMAQAAQFKGSQEIVPAKNYIQTLLDDREKPGIHEVYDASGRLEYQYELDADGGVISFTDVRYGVTSAEIVQVKEPPPPASMVPSPSGYSFVPDPAYPELFDWLRAKNLGGPPRTVELINKYENQARDIEFSVRPGQVAGDRARRLRDLAEQRREIDYLLHKVLPGEVSTSRQEIDQHRQAEEERIRKIAEITNRRVDDVRYNRPIGFFRSAFNTIAELPLVVIDAARLGFDSRARPWSQYGQRVKIRFEVEGSDEWGDLAVRNMMNYVPGGQVIALSEMADAIAQGKFNGDMAGSLAGGLTLAYLASRSVPPLNRLYGNLRNRILRGPNLAAGELIVQTSLVDRSISVEPSVIVAASVAAVESVTTTRALGQRLRGPGPGAAENRGYLDASRRFHNYHGTGFPSVKDLRAYSPDELLSLRAELAQSIPNRIQGSITHGYHAPHAQQQAAEQALIRSIDKLLKGRPLPD
ncbi:MAG: hypothetical protein ACREX4_18835 [Gammaproteobacteria bacterium]